MKFLRTIIKDFIGFEVSGIKALEHKWSAPTQLVIGANGYGKTRYMKTCTPIPLTKTTFNANGYHERIIEHDGRIFTITSDYANKGLVHTFSVDGGPNLNEGGTSTVQSDLIYQYLGYTPTVNSIVFNTLNVATMKPAERKQFFMNLLPSTDHFLTYHKQIVSKIKSLTSTLAMLTERRASLESQILSNDDYCALQMSVENQVKQSSQMLTSITKLEVVLDQLRTSPVDYSAAIEEANRLVSRRNELMALGLWHDVLNEDAVAQLHIQAVVMEQVLLHHDEKIKTLIESIANNNTLLSALSAEISTSEIELLNSQLSKLGTIYSPPKWSHSDLLQIDSVSSELLDLVSPIADGSVVVISDIDRRTMESTLRSNLGVMSDTSQSLKADREALSSIKGKANSTLSAPRECNVPTCILKQKVDELRANRETAVAKLEEAIAQKTASISKLEKETKDIEEKLVQADKFVGLVERILPIVKRVMYVTRDDLISMLSHNPIGVYQTYRSEYQIGVDSLTAENINTRIKDLTSKLDARSSIGMDSHSLKLSIAKSEEELELLRQSYADVKRRMTDIKTIKLPLAASITDIKIALQKLEKKMVSIRDEAIKDHDYQLVKVVFDNLSSAYKTSLISLAQDEATLRDQTSLKARLEDEILVSIAQCENDLILCKKIEAELSPNTGMPFVHMRAFLNRVFTMANALMSVVFVYPVKINLIEPNSSLTYKFTATIKDKQIDDDISECSDAQVAIMNTCITLAIKKLIGLGDYPFFLDEVGRQFDPQHKTRLLNLLEHIIQGQYASQLFVINHDVIIHGGLSHADVVALSTINVVLPPVYNEHVIIET